MDIRIEKKTIINDETDWLIVAPPKVGKTTLLKKIANSIALNNPEEKLIVLLPSRQMEV